jgi:hypothetical protein
VKLESLKNKRWEDFTGTQKILLMVGVSLQVSLLVSALWDIARRPKEKVRGSKVMWTGLAFVNYVGPAAYFIIGRRRD